MTPEDYLQIISEKYPNENPNDVAQMIEIVALALAEARGETPSPKHFDFGGRIICVIFDPVKFKSYVKQMNALRRAYRGIADSEDLQKMFKSSLRPELLSAGFASEAIKAGVEGSFRIPATVDEDFDGADEDRNEWR